MKLVLYLIHVGDETGHRIDEIRGLIFKQVIAEDDNRVKIILFVNMVHTATGDKRLSFGNT